MKIIPSRRSEREGQSMRRDLVADGNGTPSLNLYQPAFFIPEKKEMFTLQYLLVAHCTMIYS